MESQLYPSYLSDRLKEALDQCLGKDFRISVITVNSHSTSKHSGYADEKIIHSAYNEEDFLTLYHNRTLKDILYGWNINLLNICKISYANKKLGGVLFFDPFLHAQLMAAREQFREAHPTGYLFPLDL